EREGFLVARNAPFAGGYITQRYGRPSRGIEAVQIEINRALYLDGRTLEPLPGFESLQETLARVVAALIRPARIDSVAAE
ncbi:MAG: N-formylglutamate amidohydrolase, partial [Pseudomonadota bacterium]